MRGPPQRRVLLAALPVAIAAGVVALVLALADEEEAGEPSTSAGELPASEPVAPSAEEGADEEGDVAAGPEEERAVSRAVRGYIAAIDARDGARVCAALAPGAIDNFELPRNGGGCAASVGDSIGYRDPRGFPVFDTARLDSIDAVTVGGGEARVTARVVTRFADRDEPSIEDDVIYLVESGGEWRVARPSPTLYRAVGKPEVPPQALAPPG
jgi:hypothetical protein